ncbi:Uma2 family endonuclease [Salmonirosea aquatica]|uniref:Uma2 family endonuclease n=1 Tax=Salmonirosea aquatica TaxID=2654236 RepID=A0A7C9F783_9BACT|nr:Uma2 family endonuclease [Cytophagaceae bacterium SJW1-29]
MLATRSKTGTTKPRAEVPSYLIYEHLDGQPIHYKDYREVMSGTKTFAEIMGSSGIQSLIIAYLQRLLFTRLDEGKFTILSSESGLHLDKRNNLAGDILIFTNETLPISAINEQYVTVPPKVVIEVDIAADPLDMEADTYLFTKTQKLLDFGVEKVIWITTKTKKVTVATPQADWQVKDWHKEVEILEGITFNVGKYLVEKGSTFA